MVILAKGKPKIIQTNISEKFKLTPQKLEHAISKKTKWLILNSPSNPTGAGYSLNELKELDSSDKNHKIKLRRNDERRKQLNSILKEHNLSSCNKTHDIVTEITSIVTEIKQEYVSQRNTAQDIKHYIELYCDKHNKKIKNSLELLNRSPKHIDLIPKFSDGIKIPKGYGIWNINESRFVLDETGSPYFDSDEDELMGLMIDNKLVDGHESKMFELKLEIPILPTQIRLVVSVNYLQ